MAAAMRFRNPSPTRKHELQMPEIITGVDSDAWGLSSPSKSGRRRLDSECSTACPSPNMGFFSSPRRPGRFRLDSECSTPGASPGMNFDSFSQLPLGRAGRQVKLGFGLPSVPSCGNFEQMKLFFECESPALMPDNEVSDSDVALATPPSTPRTSAEDSAVCRTPPVAPRRSKRPPLLTALMNRNFDAVEQALQEEPESAGTPFWNHDVEPPLCAAVRLLCSAEIISLLLAYGAEVNGEDFHGRTPLMVLRSSRLEAAQTSLVSGFESIAVAEALVDAGATDAANDGVMIDTPWMQASAQLPAESEGGFYLPWASPPSIDFEQDFCGYDHKADL